VNLRPGAKAKEVLKVYRLNVLRRKQIRHLVGHRDRTGERSYGPDDGSYHLEIGIQGDPRQGTDSQGSARKML